MWETLSLALKLMIAGMLDWKSWTNLMVSDSDIVRNMNEKQIEEVRRKTCMNSIRSLYNMPPDPAERILKRYSGDREMMFIAVQEVGFALESASPELRRDREVVLAAVQKDGPALEYA